MRLTEYTYKTSGPVGRPKRKYPVKKVEAYLSIDGFTALAQLCEKYDCTQSALIDKLILAELSNVKNGSSGTKFLGGKNYWMSKDQL